VSTSSSGPLPYKVVYSGYVRDELRKLLTRAVARGLGRQTLAAAKAFEARLRIYPQFGQPLQNLRQGETLWIGVVSPLVVHYVIDDVHRVVFVVRPIRFLPRSGLGPP
jgi:hypothetical protein